MTANSQLTAGINFPWKYIAGYFMCVRSFSPFTELIGDKVGPSILGTFGMIYAELPNPDVETEQRILGLPIKHKSDYKSISRAYYDTGIKDGTNELVLLFEPRKNIWGQQKASFHIAMYPSGTWNKFFEAVNNYAAKEFKWPRPLILFQPSSTNVFPSTTNIFSL